MSFKTPRAKVAGLGAARSGVEHWWVQRVTSVALVPLTLLFIVPFARALGGGHEAVLATYGNPLNAIIAILFLGVMFHHTHAGLQVIIEDYVHEAAWRTGLVLANALGNGFLAVAGIFAVAKIAFGA